MTHFSYITNYLLPTWVWQWDYNFRIWSDLMTNNYEFYANHYAESPEKECYEWFWTSINMDDTLTKDALEQFHQMINDIETGIVKTIPAEDVLNEIENSLND